MSRRLFTAFVASLVVAAAAISGATLAVITAAEGATSTCPDVSSCLASASDHYAAAGTESAAGDADLARARQLLTATTSTTAPSSSSSAATTSTASTTTTSTTIPTGPNLPLGVPGSWRQTFGDEFSGPTLDTTKWNTSGTWQCCDGGRSQRQGINSYNNGELGYKTAPPSANYTFSNGLLTLHSLRETAPNGGAWTEGQLGSKQAFQFGVLETRTQFSPVVGFQPALWTWGTGASPGALATDGYEFYSDNRTRLYLTAHTAGGGGCQVSLGFDPTAALHTYSVAMQPGGTAWYIDGKPVCMAAGHPTGTWNIVFYMVALGASRFPGCPTTCIPQPATTHAEKITDYIRFWTH